MISSHLYNFARFAAVLLLCTACSPHADVAATQAAQPATPSTAEKQQLSACEMVPAAEMSALLGGAVIAKDGPTNGQTVCIYNAVTGISPYAELKIEWGSGEAAMMGANFANAHEPGLADPMDGLGDQAISAGPVIMIKRGEDLVSITLSGVDEALPRIKAIYALVDKRM